MKLTRIKVIKADTCGGLLDGLDVVLRPEDTPGLFSPVCLIGPNGAGKSQFLQVVAEVFQSLFHALSPSEERKEGNPSLQFIVEYLVWKTGSGAPEIVRASRLLGAKHQLTLRIERKVGVGADAEWVECALNDETTLELLPAKVVGYTSGDNETLSLPFLLSRSGYADQVGRRALEKEPAAAEIPDTRLMLIDYGTHLEVLVSNLLLGSEEQAAALLSGPRLAALHSFRCIVQLAHSAAPKAPARKSNTSSRKGIQLTAELEKYLEQLKRCATCYDVDEKRERYTFDFFVDTETKRGFAAFWESTLHLYSALHKLAMLNDLAIPRTTRNRFKRETRSRRFASRLAEPQDEDKVFRFERVRFVSQTSDAVVEYVSLSDGEHQLTQLMGTMAMVSFPNVLFLLDEPESHFNPKWRVNFTARLLDLPTPGGLRRDSSNAALQDCLLTTHAPFVPSDMRRENVLIFRKNEPGHEILVRRPDAETFGTTFDSILAVCFDVQPPMSALPREEINHLMSSDDASYIEENMTHLGDSVEKLLLADRSRQLRKSAGE